MMHGQNLARTVVGIVGNVISGLLFLSPCPTFWRICKKKDSEEFHPYPYLACVMNCLFWIFYGLPIVHPDSTLVITINGAGLFLELCYLTIFFFYTNKKNRGIIVMFLLAEFALLGAIAAVTLLCFHTHAKRSMFVGIICVVFGVIMYGSPLSILRQVVKTKSAEFLPFWLCLAGFANGIVWFTYANLKTFDPYIATANGIGGVLGLIQLCVYSYYTWIYPKFCSKDDKPAEVQLQQQNTASTNRPQV
ncbi:bidirectional sugar transporter SWEET7-like [Andrographis paniculata]|uniref:bidirectional sugar transporter SWEET7-like n=1 Tax=Andrographis paniculata TaxID=175694 RepID=UPI0021E7AB92|nr:bidirectional sugar transporter SWEET7-like [Andrographis paniculata]